MLISGEAGIGKSRLVRETRAIAAGFGCLVWQGNCYEQDRALPFAPVIELLRSQLEQANGGSLAPTPLAHLLPELGDAPASGEPEQDKRKLYESLAAVLTARTPTVQQTAHDAGRITVVEDLHWADEASLDFLLFLSRRMVRQPALLVLTYRSDDVGPGLERFLAALDRERLASEIELKPLSRIEIESVIRAVFSLSQPPQTDFVDAMHQLTDGNPFFVEEVLKSFVSAGEIFELDGKWKRKPLNLLRVPRTVQAAVRQRIEQLDADAQRLLNIAAVAGQQWDFSILQRLTQYDDATLIQHIKAMIAAQLVVEQSDSFDNHSGASTNANAFAFRHALTRQAIYSSLLARERAVLHGAIGEALEQTEAGSARTSSHAAARGDRHFGDLAYHFHEAGHWEKSFTFSRIAGEHAQQLGAPRAAVIQWSRALDAANQLRSQHGNQKTAHPTDDLLQMRGAANETLGQFEPARDDFLQALAEARKLRHARLEWRCLLDLGFLYTSRDFQVARRYFDDALAIARTLNDPAVLAQTLNRVGNWHVNVEQPGEGRRLLREALALFEDIRDETGVAATLDLLAGAMFLGGDLPAGMGHYAMSAQRFRALNQRRDLSSSLVWLTHRGTVLNTMLALPSADCAQNGQEALALAREIDWRAGESFAMVVLGMYYAAQGEWGRTFALLQDGIAIARDINHAQGLIVGLFGLGAAYLDMLSMRQAQHRLEEGLALTRPVNIPFGERLYLALLGASHVALGDLEKAREVLDAALGSGTDSPALTPTLAQRLCWLARAELAIAEGKPDVALSIAERLIASAKQTTSDDWLPHPRLLKAQGDALAELGRAAEAEAAWHAALRSTEILGARPLRWKIHSALGRLYLAQSRRSEAESHLAEARSVTAALAASISDQDMRQCFLRAANAQLPNTVNHTPLRAAKQEHEGLTEREREVAILVARGLSNREIAGTLSISLRTAGAHVGNILAKLGFGARAQIAAWATARGLLEKK